MKKNILLTIIVLILVIKERMIPLIFDFNFFYFMKS